MGQSQDYSDVPAGAPMTQASDAEPQSYSDLPPGAWLLHDPTQPGPKVNLISPQALSVEATQTQAPDYGADQVEQEDERPVFDAVGHLSGSPELYDTPEPDKENGDSEVSSLVPTQGQHDEEESADSDRASGEEGPSAEDDRQPEEDASSSDSDQEPGEWANGEGEAGDLAPEDAPDGDDELNEPSAAQKGSKASEARARAREKARKEAAAKRKALRERIKAAARPMVQDLTEIPRIGGPSGFRTEPEGTPSGFGTQAGRTAFRDPTKDEIKQYIASVAKLYDVPPSLALAVAQVESDFTIRKERPNKEPKKKGGKIKSYDYGVMQVNNTNWNAVQGPTHVFGAPIDTDRVKRDWKYNVNVGMALLSRAYRSAKFNLPDGNAEQIARETYAHYNAPSKWHQLYTSPHGTISQHVDNFMNRWHLYNH